MILSGDVLVINQIDFDELADGVVLEIPPHAKRLMFRANLIEFLDEALYEESCE
jgi:predicted ester cyclase